MDFNSALTTNLKDIERPPLLPPGTYRAVVKKIPEMGSVADGKYETLDFTLQLLEPQEDVDRDELAKYGALSGASILRRRFMFNTEDDGAFKRTLFDLKRFLSEHLQVEGADKIELKEALNNSTNHQCLVFVKWRPDANDPQVQYAEVGRTAPLA